MYSAFSKYSLASGKRFNFKRELPIRQYKKATSLWSSPKYSLKWKLFWFRSYNLKIWNLIPSWINNPKYFTSNVQESTSHISNTFPNSFDCSTNGTNHHLFSGIAHLRDDICQSFFQNIFLVAKSHPRTNDFDIIEYSNHDTKNLLSFT